MTGSTGLGFIGYPTEKQIETVIKETYTGQINIAFIHIKHIDEWSEERYSAWFSKT